MNILVTLLVLAMAGPTHAQTCNRMRDGAPCKSGTTPSRCRDEFCMTPPEECNPGSSELQECGRDSYCSSAFEPKSLMCLENKAVSRFMNYDACEGKVDGATCTSVYFEYNKGGSAAIYEETGKCTEHYCMAPSLVACDGKTDGAPCSYEGVLNAYESELSGTCDAKPMLLPMCIEDKVTKKKRATPIMAFDNRPDAPKSTNGSSIDFCDVLLDGSPCEDANGAATRCGMLMCQPLPEPCAPNAQEFEKCSALSTSGVCAGFDGDQKLSCVDPKLYEMVFRYDECQGKQDGDDCQDVEYEVTSDGRPTLYADVGGKCFGNRCLSEGVLVCQGKKVYDPCSFRGVKDGEILRFSGTCKKEYGKLMACDGRAMTPRDKVGTPTILKQGPEPTDNWITTGTPSPSKSANGGIYLPPTKSAASVPLVGALAALMAGVILALQ